MGKSFAVSYLFTNSQQTVSKLQMVYGTGPDAFPTSERPFLAEVVVCRVRHS